ncbi:hypothetical protein [Deminuibacter soli]|uniref:Uncharacterized protein n=1 Tax=Deminuibacter soli TaxID=2291815 RepID=A0A3E1NH57_9BACT|nr:hypothetical protein [Deminuibacter soli]RFM27191.1 hypothetical protein DXN05_17185 [Deminuibacter soli]
MKRLFVLSAFALTALTSCKKDEEVISVRSYIKATLNGKQLNFSSMSTATSISFDKDYMLSVIGIDTTTTQPSAITLRLTSSNPISEGTYTSLTPANATGIFNLGDSLSKVFETGIAEKAVHPFSMKITSLTEREVKGTFEGEFNSIGYATGDTSKLIFTKGEFDVLVQ